MDYHFLVREKTIVMTMEFLKRWFKPKWQSKDDSTRAQAVSASDDSALKAALPTIAVNDRDVEVRRNALARIDDLTLLADRANNDADPKLRAQAMSRLRSALACGSQPIAERVRLLKVTDNETTEYLAVHGNASELRRAALEKITRVGFLGDRALADADLQIRLALVERINSKPTLERIAEVARTKDKAVFRAVRAKLDAAKLAAGDNSMLSARALELCSQLDVLLRQRPSDCAEKLREIDLEWLKIQAHVPANLVTRVAGARQLLERALNPPVVVPVEALLVEAQSEVEAVQPVLTELSDPGLDLQLAELLLEASESAPEKFAALAVRWSKRWAQLRGDGADNQLAQQQFDGQLAAAQAQLAERAQVAAALTEQYRFSADAFMAAAEADDLKAARVHEKTLGEPRFAKVQLPNAERDALKEARSKYLKLLDWERWSGNKQRIALCEEVEAQLGSGLHPDALSNKIKLAQSQWRELDSLDGLSPEAAKNAGLAKRFRALCYRTLEPAKAFFIKRDELREKQRALIEAQLTLAEAALSAEPTVQADLLQARKELNERQRNLDQLDPKARFTIAKRIRKLNDQITRALRAKLEQAEAEKRNLIAKLRRELANAELDSGISAAKSAQSAWKRIARGRREMDDALWTEFRALIDPLFDKLKSEREAVEAGALADLERTEAVIAQVQALASEVAAGRSVAAALEVADGAWRDLGRSERQLERRYEQAVAQINAQLEALASERRSQQSQLAREKAEHCLRLEQQWLRQTACDVDAERAAWSARASVQEALETSLSARFAQALEGLSQSVAPPDELLDRHGARAAELALTLEYLAQVPSPEAFQPARMQLQVARLAQRLNQGAATPAAAEREQLLEQSLALGPLRTEARAQFEARIASTGPAA